MKNSITVREITESFNRTAYGIEINVLTPNAPSIAGF
ncbi:MAG: hypothetical protein PETM_02704 [Petrimonas sp.]